MNQNAVKYIENYGYSLSDQIGKGYSSKVYKGWDEQTNAKVAIKVIEKAGLKTPLHTQLLISEIDAMKTLESPYIMKLYNVYQTTNNTYLILEFCEGGDLGKIIKQKGKFHENQVQEIIHNLVHAYACLEKNGILHRDIKPANILMSQNGQAKLADFGFAKTPQSKPLQANVNIGSPLYMSPEALRKNKYSDKSDIWAIGVSAYELLYGQVPWQARSEKELGQKMVNQKINFSGCSEECRDFIQECLKVNENERATIGYLMNHGWIRKKQQITQMVKGKGIDKNVLVGYNNQKKQRFESHKQGKENSSSSKKMYGKEQKVINNQEQDIALLSQVNLCRYLYKIGQLISSVHGFDEILRNKMEYLIAKCLMIKMNTLLETKSGNNVCKLENYDDYVYSGSFWKICQALESYHQKYSQYFYMIWEKAQFIEDKKLDAILDQNFKEYESFYIIVQSFLKQTIKELEGNLELQLDSYDSDEELEENDQNRVVLLDYMVTWYQLNKLIIESQNDLYQFAENSKIDQIAEGEPVQLLYGHFQQIVKKINILSIV